MPASPQSEKLIGDVTQPQNPPESAGAGAQSYQPSLSPTRRQSVSFQAEVSYLPSRDPTMPFLIHAERGTRLVSQASRDSAQPGLSCLSPTSSRISAGEADHTISSPATLLSCNFFCAGSVDFRAEGRYNCTRCNFSVKPSNRGGCFYRFRTKDGIRIGIDCGPLWNSHFPKHGLEIVLVKYGCLVCRSERQYDWDVLRVHLASRHTKMELESVFGEAVNECSCEVVCATGCAVRMYSESMAKKETKMSKDEEEEKRLLAHLRQ